MPWLFAGTLFLSAALLFCVQPMIAKMILPLLGGSAAVWNTCMVFFQAALLAGYLYAHAVTTYLSLRSQVIVQLALLALAFIVLPVSLPADLVAALAGGADPVIWELRLLLAAVGWPFFVVSTSAPLLQKWFAGSGHPSAHDPYFLYAASNLGSMLALLGYPFLLEPTLRLTEQSSGWTIGYAVLVLLTASCGLCVLRVRNQESGIRSQTDEVASPESKVQSGEEGRLETLGTGPATLNTRRRLRWVLLAFVPSSLMLGVTTYITQDVAAMPLLWVVPLALYLFSFILVFAKKQVLPQIFWLWALPVATLIVFFTMAMEGSTRLPHWQLIPLHWLILLIAALTCHGELAKDRPPSRQLTEFYLWLSVGGVLGGMFNALLAPYLFKGGIFEYPLVLLLACLLRPGRGLWDSSRLDRWLDLIVPLGAGALALALALFFSERPVVMNLPSRALILGVLIFVCFLCIERPIRFALSLAVGLLSFLAALPGEGRTLFADRNFFGIVRVQDDPKHGFRHLAHGSTVHGLQRIDLEGKPHAEGEPLSYFTRRGPIGQVFDVFNDRMAGKQARVAVTGLGVGALSSYAKPDQDWTFYEIDPAIERVALDPRFFSYLAHCPAKKRIILGDARLQLQQAADAAYSLIILDAFSSDSVPTHLLSKEALTVYLRKLAPGGLLAYNISNRYLDLKPVLADLAANADPPLVGYGRDDYEQDDAGKFASQWVVMARRPEDLGFLIDNAAWKELHGRRGARVWTDDFSNLWTVLKWR